LGGQNGAPARTGHKRQRFLNRLYHRFLLSSCAKVRGKPRDQTPGSPIIAIDYGFSLACEPSYLTIRVDYSSLTLFTEAISVGCEKTLNPAAFLSRLKCARDDSFYCPTHGQRCLKFRGQAPGLGVFPGNGRLKFRGSASP
jgi:hypothetical protein